MSDALSFAEIDGAQVELLPARTVLSSYGVASFFTPDIGDIDINTNENTNTNTATATATITDSGLLDALPA